MNTFYTGDARKILEVLPDKSIHCGVTSPPYFGLRDYGVEGQLGLEKTPEDYVNHLVEVFREFRRTLRDDGTLWLNLGDSYASGGRGGGGSFTDERRAWKNNSEAKGWKSAPPGLKNKDLVGIPWMVAFALRADGWYLRSDIIWAKTNPMPESVRDRPTRSHEHIFLLCKSSRYFYDNDAIKEPAIYPPGSRADIKKGGFNSKYADNDTARKGDEAFRAIRPTKNKRTVWSLSSGRYDEAHFAVFPKNLVIPCILAGTSLMNCPKCKTPWTRVINKTGHINKRKPANVPNNSPTKTDSTGWAPTTVATDMFIPGCNCEGNDGSGNSIVLDPFGGSGTVAMVASELGRDSIYIDLNSDYTEMAKKRCGLAF